MVESYQRVSHLYLSTMAKKNNSNKYYGENSEENNKSIDWSKKKPKHKKMEPYNRRKV